MTEKQQEIYLETKARLRRMGKENPADVIVALAEEIDRYRDKVRSMEEFTAKKRGNETGIVAELRNKQSRDNRELLDRAADRIEELEQLRASGIVKCKDCRYCSNNPSLDIYRCARFMAIISPEHFCSLGERQKDAT